MPLAEPVGERVHVAVLDHGLVDDLASTGAVASSCGMFAVFAATLPATSSRPSTDRSMLAHGAHEQRAADRDDQRRDEADDERDRPVAVPGDARRAVTCPTATFRSARAACRIRTPESLIRAMPPSSAVCCAHHLDRLLGRPRLPGDPAREHHDRDHDRRGDRDHHDAERDPDLPLRRRRNHCRHLRARIENASSGQLGVPSYPSITETLTVEHRPQRTGPLRHLLRMHRPASTLPHETQT